MRMRRMSDVCDHQIVEGCGKGRPNPQQPESTHALRQESTNTTLHTLHTLQTPLCPHPTRTDPQAPACIQCTRVHQKRAVAQHRTLQYTQNTVEPHCLDSAWPPVHTQNQCSSMCCCQLHKLQENRGQEPTTLTHAPALPPKQSLPQCSCTNTRTAACMCAACMHA